MGPKYFATFSIVISCGIQTCFGLMPIAQSSNFYSFCVMGSPCLILRSYAYKGVTNLNGLKLPFKPNSSFILLFKAQGGGGGKKGTSCELRYVIFFRKLKITKLTFLKIKCTQEW